MLRQIVSIIHVVPMDKRCSFEPRSASQKSSSADRPLLSKSDVASGHGPDVAIPRNQSFKIRLQAH